MAKLVNPRCRAFQTAIEVLARPWNGLILGLLQERPLRFSELEQAAHGLGPKTLTARLRALEAGALVTRCVEGGPPVRVQYALTAKGRAFGQVAKAIHRWGSRLVADEPKQASWRVRPSKPK